MANRIECICHKCHNPFHVPFDVNKNKFVFIIFKAGWNCCVDHNNHIIQIRIETLSVQSSQGWAYLKKFPNTYREIYLYFSHF